MNFYFLVSFYDTRLSVYIFFSTFAECTEYIYKYTMRITRNFMKFHYVVMLTLSESNLKMYTKLTKICQISICKYSNSRNCIRTAKFRIF